MLCSQLNTALVQQLDSFVSNDMTRLTVLKDAFHTARTGMTGSRIIELVIKLSIIMCFTTVQNITSRWLSTVVFLRRKRQREAALMPTQSYSLLEEDSIR